MDPYQFTLIILLLAGNVLLQWMRFVIERAQWRATFNKFTMELDRFLDGDDKVRTKLLNLEQKLKARSETI